MKNISKSLSVIGIIMIFLGVINSGVLTTIVVAENENATKFLRAEYLVTIPPEVIPIYSSFEEAIHTISTTNHPVSFTGRLTGYGPDCVGCTGRVACRPGQDVRGGNIHRYDPEFGMVRIVAADRRIPCGSIVKLHNIAIYDEPVVAIVMDRGGAVRGNIMDLLFETERNMRGFFTHNQLQMDILRWGW